MSLNKYNPITGLLEPIAGALGLSEIQQEIVRSAALYDPSGTIKESDDLNDFVVPGNYVAGTAAIAQSLLNKPADLAYGFSLKVEVRGDWSESGTHTIFQTIYKTNANGSTTPPQESYIYYREKGHAVNVWTPWRKVATDRDISGMSDSFGVKQLICLHSGESKGITYTYDEEALTVHVTGTLEEEKTSQYVVYSVYLKDIPNVCKKTVNNIKNGAKYILSDGKDGPNGAYIICWQWHYDTEQSKWINTHNYSTRGATGAANREKIVEIAADTEKIDFVLEVLPQDGWQKQVDEYYLPMLRPIGTDATPDEFGINNKMIKDGCLAALPIDFDHLNTNEDPDNLSAGMYYGTFNGLGWGYLLCLSSQFQLNSKYMCQLYLGGNTVGMKYRSKVNNVWGSWKTVTLT